MYKIETQMNEILGENTYVTTLKNGLTVYICKKEGFKKKIGMFGTKYGSLINDFVDITTNQRIQVPDGIAHFLEHKLFEQEGANALDLFSKIGVSSNAYTSFDQTVYYFETMDKFKESIELLIKLVKTPYFTEENVQKEQGIIGQEIMMYEDDADYMAYFNTLKAMYQTHPVKIDIAGTVESISHINKDLLYTCYHTFYSPQNMFFVVVGDVDVESTIHIIEENIKLYEPDYDTNKEIIPIETFLPEEKEEIANAFIEQKMDVYMPQICVGYKLKPMKKTDMIKADMVCSILSDLYFSKLTPFYQENYEKGIINDPIQMFYEGSKSFSHVLVSGSSVKIDELRILLLDYLDSLLEKEIDINLFDSIKKKKIGNLMRASDSLSVSYRRIIESILSETDIYADVSILNEIQPQDLKEFLQLLTKQNRVVSILNEKSK